MEIDPSHRENEGRNLQSRRFRQNGALLAILRSRFARLISRSLFLVVIFLLIPHIRPVFNDQGNFLLFDSRNPQSLTKQVFDDLIDELENAEILTEYTKSLVLISGSNSNIEAPNRYADRLRTMGAEVVTENNFWPRGSFEEESFDIVFTLGQYDSRFVDRVLKSGGAVVAPAKDLSLNVYVDEFNYSCVYFKPYSVESAFMALVKPSSPDQSDADELSRRPNWHYISFDFS